MNLRMSIVACLLVVPPIGEVAAQTSNDACAAGARVSGGTGGVNTLETLLASKTVCYRTAGSTDWTWQEYHATPNGGANNLIDYKRGAGHPTDPTKPVGSWSVGSGANAAVRYSYTGGASYTFIVCDLGAGSYRFQGTGGASTVTPATLKSGSGPCP